jgi:hypothetical protein
MDARRHLLVPLVSLLMMGLTAEAAPPPAPWTARDMGVWDAPGAVDVDARGVWTLRGAQGETYLGTDSFFFVYQPLSGDGSILALLLGQEGGNPASGSAGLLILGRAAVRAPAVRFGMTASHGLTFSFRRDEFQNLVNEGDGLYGRRQFPTWLRLQREGNRFTPFASTDGFGWTQLRSPLSLFGFPKDALAGITVASNYGGPVSGSFSTPVVAPGQVSPIVQACAGNGIVLLTWPPVSNAVGYIVRRSRPNTPGFAADMLTPQSIRETSFTDTNVVSGQPLRYLVSAVFDQGGHEVEGWSTAVIASPISTPANLSGCDINLEATQYRGGISFDPLTGIYKITGGGGDTGPGEDHCFYASRLVDGDFQITAKILDKPLRTTAGARAGLMLRESLDGPARMACLAGTASNGVAFLQRKATDGDLSPFTPLLTDRGFQPPLYFRLVRRGSTIAAFVSADGTRFTPADTPRTFDPPLKTSLYVGYAITSRNPIALTTNRFSDLTIGPPPAP